MDISPETPDVTTKPTCYDLTNILVRPSVDLKRAGWLGDESMRLQTGRPARLWNRASNAARSWSRLAAYGEGAERGMRAQLRGTPCLATSGRLHGATSRNLT